VPTRVYALLVGINDYGPDIESLEGCLNDVDRFHDYLKRVVDPADLAVEVLKNGDATRASIVGRFRAHLGQARSGDVALFQFCGHGAQWASAAAWRESFPDGKDEGLVCSDSRRPGGYDLADKELAVLIAEAAANEAHVAILFDCCHSGSGTRDVEAARGLKPRLTRAVTTERPLESYLDGHYSRLREAHRPLFVPAARHILLAACERGQLAQEAPGHGLFTSTLLDVLEKSGGEVSYADLFVRCRAAVRARAFDQDPQFEAYGRFDAGAGFLGRPLERTSRGRYLAYCDQGVWTAECGAINGVPDQPETAVSLALYPEDDPATKAGTARAVQVGPQRSEIALEFDSSESARYLAEITSLPAAPMPVAFAGDDDTRSAVQDALSRCGVHVSLVGADAAAGYALTAGDGRLALRAAGQDQAIGFADAGDGTLARAAASLAPAVKQVMQWERCLALQNRRTAMDTSLVDVVYVERLAGGGEREHAGPEAVLTLTSGGRRRRIRGRFRVRNRTGQTLWVVLAYLSDAYGVYVLSNDAVPAGDAWITIWGEGPTDTLDLEDGIDQSVERFKLLVATEKADDFLLAQPALSVGDEYGATRAIEGVEPIPKLTHTNEWFARDFRVRWRGDAEDTVSRRDRQPLPFGRHHAFIVGIDAYQKVSPLKTAVSDARRLAQVLAEKQHFDVHAPLLDAGGDALRTLLRDTMARLVAADDRVLFYFAGHGIAADGDDGPAGYLVPADADPADLKTLIAMAELQRALQALPCRHLLLILDCCFSGAFQWASRTRSIGSLMPRRIYKERFDRFVVDPAWQVITSAAYDQKALDVLQGRATGDRGLAATADGEAHSPFALALFDALAGDADFRNGREGDGLITATEVYAYIRDRVEPETLDAGQGRRQTPGFFPLSKHDKGEFIFLHPKHRLNLPPIPARSPYKGLQSFDEADRSLFYGRDRAIRELQARCDAVRLLVVSGASGTGKSSVVKAGLLPLLREAGHRILPVIRPGLHPLAALEEALAADGAAGAPSAVLLIDQFEELITRCPDAGERAAFLARLRRVVDDEAAIHRVIITVRSDFEPQVSGGDLKALWDAGRCTVPPFSLDELKEIIVMPTMQEVLIFDPPELVDEIVGDVVQSPGALPLLAYALSELYEAYRASGREDRALRKTDYERLGGVMGALRSKADTLYQALDPAQQATMRKIVLRMVSVEGDLAGRRVPMADLDYSADENPRAQVVIERLVDARLIVKGEDYIEPAHDALVRAWKTLHEWIHAAGRDTLILGQRLGPDADQFARTRDPQLLWNRNPNLAVAARALRDPQHTFNAREVVFVRKSVSRNRRRMVVAWALAFATVVSLMALSVWALLERATAEEEKERALLSLFEGLSLNMNEGQPGSLCLNGLCDTAPPGDGKDAWRSLGQLPDDLPAAGGPPASRVFAASRKFGWGSVVVYAQDALTLDEEITDGSDNLLFAQNALAWLTPLAYKSGCPEQITILAWEGTFAKVERMQQVRAFIERRGWVLKVARPETLEADLECAAVLWYLSDWEPPAEFADRHVPLVEDFVHGGGGLLVGGLGWSYAEQGGPDGASATAPYAADLLGRPFGFAFTRDAFVSPGDTPITLQP
jgi:hypothetical protein